MDDLGFCVLFNEKTLFTTEKISTSSRNQTGDCKISRPALTHSGLLSVTCMGAKAITHSVQKLNVFESMPKYGNRCTCITKGITNLMMNVLKTKNITIINLHSYNNCLVYRN